MANFTDSDLSRMARFPGEGLRQWVRLTELQRAVVVDRMKHFYGHKFATDFQANAARRPRPDRDVQVTNDGDITPEQLKSAGFKFAGDPGGVPRWVHPSGKEVWLLSPPSGAPPPSPQAPQAVPQVKPPQHPDVEDAQRDAQSLTQQHDSLWQRASNSFGPDGTPRPDFDQAQFEQDYSDYDDRLDEALSNARAALAEGSFTPEEGQAMRDAISALEQLRSEPGPTYANTRGN